MCIEELDREGGTSLNSDSSAFAVPVAAGCCRLQQRPRFWAVCAGVGSRRTETGTWDTELLSIIFPKKLKYNISNRKIIVNTTKAGS